MISDALYNHLETLIESRGLKLYGIDFLKENTYSILRIYLYKKEGVTLQNCEEINNLISPLLDVELENKNSYLLEVSSPGIERVLKEPRHFTYSIGEKVEVLLTNKKKIRGILKEYRHNSSDSPAHIVVDIDFSKHDDYPKGLNDIGLDKCKKVSTFFVWNRS